MRFTLPPAVSRRRLVAGLACSLVFHLAVAAVGLWVGSWLPPVVVKQGEPLFVELPPEVPEEPAPPGNPASPPGPVIAAKPKAPAKPAPRPKASQPRAPSPAPARVAEPSQVAKALPPPVAESPTLAPSGLAREEPQSEPALPAPAVAEPKTALAPPAPAVAEPKLPPSPPESGRLAALPPEPGGSLPGGGGGLRRGRGGIEGEPIPLETRDPRYTDYFERVRQQIKANWIYPREAGERGIGGQLVIDFAIAKTGYLEAIELRRSSGVPVLDLYALNAVKLAQPFPPVPDSVARGALPIQGFFTYQIVDASLLNQFLR